jgi:NOL1/NOP2/fmu family ribosome biogenesis protein
VRAQFLTRREVRRINELVERAYGARFEEDGYHYFLRGKDLYRIARDLERVDIDQVKEVFAGLYLCEVLDETVRFSIEGSQIIGPSATQRVITLERDEEWFSWLERHDISAERFSESGYGVLPRAQRARRLLRLGPRAKRARFKSWIPKGRAVGRSALRRGPVQRMSEKGYIRVPF